MMPIANYPRCAGYLKAMRFKLNDESMTDYGWAVALSENWSDEFLVEDGRVNFDTMDGPAILTEFERLLRTGTGPRKSQPASPEMDKLRAFLGARGIKTSWLEGAADYWHVAAILWPDAVQAGAVGTHDELLAIIAGMSKKQRQSARGNLAKVPAKWRAAA